VRYTEGKKFRVIKEGAKLSGLVPGNGPWHNGWGRDLVVGEVITCRGFQWGWGSDPGQEVFFTADNMPPHASYVKVTPTVYGAMTSWPQDGYLEEITDE
jgi:hypothetical protein